MIKFVKIKNKVLNNKYRNMKKTILLVWVLSIAMVGFSQKKDTTKTDKGYQFTVVKQLPTTSVKNQYRAGTCWSYSTISFLESELLRMGKGEHDLSEMWIVRHTYNDKAEKYVRMLVFLISHKEERSTMLLL